jgi:hypothetical protein
MSASMAAALMPPLRKVAPKVTVITMKESTPWLVRVEKLLRSHRCRPRVRRLKKWKSCTSQYWAAM